MAKQAAEKKTTSIPEKKLSLQEKIEEQKNLKRIEVEKSRMEIEDSINSDPLKKKKKVHSFLYSLGLIEGTEELDFAVMFLTEPNFNLRKMAVDMGYQSPMDGAELILDTCIIKEKSDPRIYSENSGDDYPDLRMGAMFNAKELINKNIDLLKKN